MRTRRRSESARILLVEGSGAGEGPLRAAAGRGALGPCRVEVADTLEEAVERLGPAAIDMVVADLGASGSDPVADVRRLLACHPGRPVVLVGESVRPDSAGSGPASDRAAVGGERVEAEARRRLAAIVDSSDDAILSISLDGTIETWNRGAAVYFEDGPAEAIGRPLPHYLAPEVIEQLPDLIRRVRAREHVHAVENEHIRADGRRFHLSLSFSPLADRDGNVTGAAVIGRDITRMKLLEADLKQLAFYDPLTRLANRRFLIERLDYALALGRRRGARVGLIYLDLESFKEINDRSGHAAGDSVLVEVAERLRLAARDSDLVARLGGDEFVILLSELESEEGAREAMVRFQASLEPPIRAAGRAVAVRAQLGLALFPEDGTDSASLLAAADRAMYRTKRVGGDGSVPGSR